MDSRTLEKLTLFAQAIVNQQKAQIIVKAMNNSTGFWFGGGNVVKNPADSSYLLTGRYRNYGDSRTGLAAGQRGLELAIFQSEKATGPYEKIKSFSKSIRNFVLYNNRVQCPRKTSLIRE